MRSLVAASTAFLSDSASARGVMVIIIFLPLLVLHHMLMIGMVSSLVSYIGEVDDAIDDSKGNAFARGVAHICS